MASDEFIPLGEWPEPRFPVGTVRQLREDISRLRTWLLWSLQDKRDWKAYMRGRGCTAEQVDEVAKLLGEVKDGE